MENLEHYADIFRNIFSSKACNPWLDLIPIETEN
jgi:hypothetical protein